jgi:maltooligosyltrehalose trehalohydrolase
MQKHERGYFSLCLEHTSLGARYKYRLNGAREFPDPASRYQPDGVHGSSEVVDLAAFPWTDRGWNGHPLERTVLYEMHVGTFTPEGTFNTIVPKLDGLAKLGITTLELMPVAQFPGSRNWGYDGVYPFAPHNTYGPPQDLQALVNAAHECGLSMALDVVYNHLGPEGNYFGQFGPYFTDKYRTPWGQAINYDDAQSDAVRRMVIENALYWIENFHFDALRLDAIHGIFDFSATHLLAELRRAVDVLEQRLGRHIHLIAESDLNDSRVIRPFAQGGYAMDAQWSDDFHHSVHTLLTPERSGYYGDFGTPAHFAKTLRQGWCYDGEYSQYRLRRHGNSPEGLTPTKFVVFSQNHDQTGNRAWGERLSVLIDFEGLKLAAAITLLSPFVPLLFMGEEYGETAPFLYFISHGDPDLVEAVRRGRASDFASYARSGELPDPQSESTFAASKVQPELAQQEPHKTLYRFYKELMRFRKSRKLGKLPGKSEHREISEFESQQVVTELRESRSRRLAFAYCFSEGEAEFRWPLPEGRWYVELDSADAHWRGSRDASLPRTLESQGILSLGLFPRSTVVLEQSKAQTVPA